MGFDGKVVGRRQRILRKLLFPVNGKRAVSSGAKAESLAKHQVAAKAGLRKSRSSSARTEASSREDTGVFSRTVQRQATDPPWPFRNSKAAAHKASGVLEQSLEWSP